MPTPKIAMSLAATVALAASGVFTAVASADEDGPLDLQVDGRRGWVVTDDPTPRLSWAPRGQLPGLSGWRLRVVRTDGVADGAVREWHVSAQEGPWCIARGLDLPSRARFAWSVTPEYDLDAELQEGGDSARRNASVRGRRGAAADSGAWKGPAQGFFEVGLREASDWQAKWIGLDPKVRGKAAVWFRKPFKIGKPVDSARLYVSGLGWHEAWLNGRRLGDGVLEPAQTDYERRVFYVVHDVTGVLKAGDNALGVWVGDGWYNQDRVWGPKGLSYGQPRMIAQLELRHTDGSRTVVASDGSWRARPSAVTATNVYQGEDYDARLELPGWSEGGFAESGWTAVQTMPAPEGRLVASEIQPCRRLRTLPVRAWAQPAPGVHVADFGQNITGWARLRVRATPGTRVTLRFAESRLPDGGIDPLSTGVIHTKKVQTDTYVCRGGGEEVWEPRFAYHVFQYAELTVEDGKLEGGSPAAGTLEGMAVATDMPVRGEFACSDPVIQKAYEIAEWTLVGNLQGLPSDCPGRERCGWTGDAHLLTPFALHRFDGTALWNKYMGDILTSADREGPMLMFGKDFGDRKTGHKVAGLPTMIAPGKRSSGAASPDWGSAIVFVPWDIYRLTGDLRPLERNYDRFRQWVEHLRTQAVDHIVSNGLGDWCTPWRAGGERPSEPRAYYARIVPELSTACYWRSTDLLARIAQLLGRNEDAKHYRELADAIASAYVARFFDASKGRFGDQTINAIAVQWGLLGSTRAGTVADALARQVADDGHHFYTGVFGLTSLFQALGRHGHADTIARIFANPKAPGFRYLIDQGATTCWETWPVPSDAGKPFERSKSHPFQGAWATWCFEDIGGIRPGDSALDDQVPAFRSFSLSPSMMRQLSWARCREHTAMGQIESSWRRDGKCVEWTVEVPPGSRASLHPPGRIEAVCLAGSPLVVTPKPTEAQMRLKAGRYQITLVLDD